MSYRVLVVDDEDQVRELFTVALQRAGYHVSSAASGTEALELAAAKPPDAAVVDLLLDDIPGVAVMQDLLKHNPFVQCIVVTGRAPEESAQSALSLGAHTYIMKPCEASQVVMAVRQATQQGALRRELALKDALLDALATACRGAAVVIDGDGKLLAGGGAVRNMPGLAEVSEGSSIWSGPSEPLAGWKALVEQVAQSGELRSSETVCDAGPCRITVQPLKSPDQHPWAFVLLCTPAGPVG